jgi:hypothetical protein
MVESFFKNWLKWSGLGFHRYLEHGVKTRKAGTDSAPAFRVLPGR